MSSDMHKKMERAPGMASLERICWHHDSFIKSKFILRIRGPVAQLGRAIGSYFDSSESREIPIGQGFESLQARS